MNNGGAEDRLRHLRTVFGFMSSCAASSAFEALYCCIVGLVVLYALAAAAGGEDIHIPKAECVAPSRLLGVDEFKGQPGMRGDPVAQQFSHRGCRGPETATDVHSVRVLGQT